MTNPMFDQFLRQRGVIAPAPRVVAAPPGGSSPLSALTGAMQAMAVQQAMQAPAQPQGGTLPFVLPAAPSGPPLGELILPNGVMLRNAQGQVMLPPTTPWTPPPGYIEPNPSAGMVVPSGGYQNVTPTGPAPVLPDSAVPGPLPPNVAAPVAGAPVVAGPTVAPSVTAPTVAGPMGQPTDALPPIVLDPLLTYAAGTPLPEGTTEAGWTPEGIRQVTTPDGALRQVDGAGLLAGSGVTQPTEALTIIPETGVVQAPGGTGQAPVALTPQEQAAQNLDAPEDQAAIAPYLAEMQAMGLAPEDYLSFLTTRAQAETYDTGQQIIDLQAQQDQLRIGFTTAQPTPELQAEYLATQAQIETLQAGGTLPGTESSANWDFAHQATDLFAQAGLAGSNDGLVGTVVGAAGTVLDAPRVAVVTGVGDLIQQAANNSGGHAQSVEAIAQWVNPLQSAMDLTFDPVEAASWAERNADLVNAAATNGYDADGDGAPDFTGGRAVWELYQGTKAWYERAGADLLLDPLSYIGGVATIGRRIAGEAPEAAVAVTRAVTSADDVAPVARVAEGAAAVAPEVVAPTVSAGRRVLGAALQAPDRLINQPVDRAVSGALGLVGDAVNATPGLNWLARSSDRVAAETDRDRTLAALDRTTALERRNAEVESIRLTPGEPLPGANTTVSGNPDAVANRRYDELGQHVDAVADPLGARQVPDPVAPEAATPTEALNPRLVNEPKNELDRAFRDVASKPWTETVQDRALLFRSRVVNRRALGDAPDEDAIERARSFVDLTESAWRRASQNNDTATLNSNSFRQWMTDADELHARVGRRGATSKNLPLAWERVPNANAVPTGGMPEVLAGDAVNAVPAAQEPNTASVTRTRLDQADLPLSEQDRTRLNEVLTGSSKTPQEPIWDRYQRHLADAEDQNMDVSEATEYAGRMTGDDIMASRGIDPKRRGKLSWWGDISGKIATGVLYKPTTLIRRVIQDRAGDAFQLATAKEFNAIALASDPKLIAEGIRSQQGVRGADRAFGNSEASRIIGDTGLGTKFRGELTLANTRVDRAGGTVRQTDLARRRQTELTQADTTAGRFFDKVKYFASGAPREIINGLGATSRIGLYADQVRSGLPTAVRRAREAATSTASRYGFDADAALVDDAFASLTARQAETGARGFDAVQLREALRTSARSATADASGAVSVGLQRNIDQWSTEVARTYQDGLTKLDEAAMGRVDDVLFSYRPTNLDEAISKVVFFHYWSSRATKFYVTEGLKNPVLAANYFRAREGQDRAAEEGGFPRPVQGFMKLLDTDGGFTLYMNPTALLQTYATFREAAGSDTDGRNYLERFLDGEEAGGLGTIGMLNPLISYGMDIVGLLPTTAATDPLATNTDRRLAGNAINWARANGYLDALPGDQDAPADAPYQRLLNEVRDQSSSLLSGFLPGLARHVESVDPTANQTRQLHDSILRVANEQFPDDPDRALDEATIAMYDPDSDLYQQGWEDYTDAQLVQSGLTATSPFPIQTRSTQVDENTATINELRAANPDLTNTTLTASEPEFARAQIERGIISEASPEAATLDIATERAGNVGTPEGRLASRDWSAIAYGDPAQITTALPDGLTIGATVYTPAQIATLPEETRMTLADLTIGSDPARATALGDQRTARDSFRASSPELTAYNDWRNSVRDAAAPVDPVMTEEAALIAWADRTAETNGTFASWWRGERAYVEQTVSDPAQREQRLAMSATGTDAFTAYGGHRADVFAADPQPMTGPPTVGGATGGGSGPASVPTDPRVELENQISQYQADVLLVNTVLRSATGSPDLDYTQIDFPGGQDVADRILQRNGIEPPRMGRALYQYATFVEDQPPGSPRDIDSWLRMQQTPTTVTDTMASRYGQ